MSNPVELTQDPKRTKMVAPEKKVKLKILRDCAKPGSDINTPEIMKEGTIVELPVKEAKDLLSRKVTGTYAFSGQRADDNTRHMIAWAEVYREDLEDLG